ncbi:cation:proton antiporter [Cryobacterium sp. PH29-G1]|uniref:cation:proton antiporter n=1 Tax=Cryobacterium sp. PH29-G1 TaxID=3046211 RepID=UPI0024B94BA9|nr:cation:proton antiporter [Cryobacterium sp. PH29-G1]MDJ0348126.1 cation:proton antiporter [Cryobacterium sp. PH29-G1]
MDPLALNLIELGAVVFSLGLLARLAGQIGMSPIPFYLLGGLAFGTGGLVELEGMKQFAHLSGEIGVILLLLMLGLEYSASELFTGLRSSWRAGAIDLLLNFLPGAALAVLLGWGPVGAMVMGGVTYISSSGIAAKVMTDLGRLGNRETRVVISLLVFEDLTMAVYLPILTTILAGAGFLGGLTTVGIALAVVSLILAVALRHGHHISRVVQSENAEVFLLNILGAALLVAGLASAMHVSTAVGAFLLGIAISGATSHSATRLLTPLRDLFGAIFFVAFGLNTDPASIPPVLGWALVLALVTTASKMATGSWAAKRLGIDRPGRLRAGAALIARGEFSIVIAGLAIASGAVTQELAAMATAYVLIMAIIGPLAARYVEPLTERLLPAASVAKAVRWNLGWLRLVAGPRRPW